jgi:hypothetical protein
MKNKKLTPKFKKYSKNIQPSSGLKKYWLLGLGIGLMLLLLGAAAGFWFYYQWWQKPGSVSLPSWVEEVSEETAETSEIEKQDFSDEIESIEADLESFEFEDLDKELNDIEAELSAE